MKYYKISMFYKGKQQSFILKSLNKAEAIIDAKKSFHGILVKIEEISMPFSEKIKIFKDLIGSKLLKKRLHYPIYIASIRQLAVLVKAGISLKDALEDIGNNTKDSLMKELFLKAAEAIDNGKSLSDTFAEYEQYVGGLSLAMIRLGEQTGDLVMALNYLADIYDNMYQNRRKMIRALRYPIVVLMFIAVAFVILILMVVPKFKAIFEQLHAQLPLPTRILLATEHILSNYGLIVLSASLLIIFLLIFFYKTSIEFKYQIDRIFLKTYLIKSIIKYGTLHRLLLTLSSLLRSGIPLLDALKISEGIIENEVMKRKIKVIITGINQGRTFADVLKETELVNYIALRMISAGEQSGELDVMLENASEYYSDRFENVIENMQAAIEPIMLTAIASMVLLIALGIFLPMWDLAEAAKNA